MKFIFLFLFTAVYMNSLYAGYFSKDIKADVKNECSYSWSSHADKKFVIATVSLIVELKDKKNESSERAYIYLNCRGDGATKDSRPYYVIKGTQCMGIRIMGIDRPVLSEAYIFPIRNSAIKILSKPTDENLILEWEKYSTFIINNNKSFAWTMTSQLTGETHTGTTECF